MVRARAIRSASPVETMASACSNSVMRPTAMTGTRTAAFTARLWDLVAGTGWDALRRVEAASGNVDGRTAARHQCSRELDSLRNVPTAFDPVATGHTHAHRSVRRKGSPHGLEHLERKTHGVLQAPTVLVRSAIRERRKELMQQIAVR